MQKRCASLYRNDITCGLCPFYKPKGCTPHLQNKIRQAVSYPRHNMGVHPFCEMIIEPLYDIFVNQRGVHPFCKTEYRHWCTISSCKTEAPPLCEMIIEQQWGIFANQRVVYSFCKTKTVIDVIFLPMQKVGLLFAKWRIVKILNDFICHQFYTDNQTNLGIWSTWVNSCFNSKRHTSMW